VTSGSSIAGVGGVASVRVTKIRRKSRRGIAFSLSFSKCFCTIVESSPRISSTDSKVKERQ
jgi:hypothetical protein